MKKTFKGIVGLIGDDGNCFGVHLNLLQKKKNKTESFNSSLIDYLDKIGKKYNKRKIKITLIVETLK